MCSVRRTFTGECSRPGDIAALLLLCRTLFKSDLFSIPLAYRTSSRRGRKEFGQVDVYVSQLLPKQNYAEGYGTAAVKSWESLSSYNRVWIGSSPVRSLFNRLFADGLTIDEPIEWHSLILNPQVYVCHRIWVSHNKWFVHTPHHITRILCTLWYKNCALFCQQNATSYLIWPNLFFVVAAVGIGV